MDDAKKRSIAQSIMQSKGMRDVEPVATFAAEQQSPEDLLNEAMAHAPLPPSMTFKGNPQPSQQPQEEYPDYDAPKRVVQAQRKQQSQDKETAVVLNRLKEQFGLRRLPPYILKIGDFTFQLQAINKQRLSFAAGIADLLTMYNEEFKRVFDTALAASYVTHIDDTPLWIAMGVTPGNNVAISDPDAPPLSISKMAHARFFDFLHLESYDTLSDAIVRAYDENIEPHARVVNKLISMDADGRASFVCPETACKYETQEVSDGTYFCKYHGVQLVPKTTANALPLA
jgi:hypothetical protein